MSLTKLSYYRLRTSATGITEPVVAYATFDLALAAAKEVLRQVDAIKAGPSFGKMMTATGIDGKRVTGRPEIRCSDIPDEYTHSRVWNCGGVVGWDMQVSVVKRTVHYEWRIVVESSLSTVVDGITYHAKQTATPATDWFCYTPYREEHPLTRELLAEICKTCVPYIETAASQDEAAQGVRLLDLD